MKDGNAEDTRNLLPVDDAANECVPQGPVERPDNAVFQFSPSHPRLSSNRAEPSLQPALYGLLSALSLSPFIIRKPEQS